MRRLALLLLALSLAVVAPVAHAAPAERGGPTAHAAQLPGDRDSDGTPDSVDQCPDTPGGFNGCPQPPNGATGNVSQAPADSDSDGTPDASDQCPGTPGGNQGCPPPPDRDHDAIPDATDRCPDELGIVNLQGCPQKSSIDRDGDGVLNTDDACPDAAGKQANGCDPFVFRYFFATLSLKEFAADKPRDTTYCSGGPLTCKTTHVTFTLSAQTAKAARITSRRIGSISVSNPTFGFARGISRANRKKLARLKKITVTIHAWVTLTTGQKIEAPEKTLTIKGYAAHQFNNPGVATDPEGI